MAKPSNAQKSKSRIHTTRSEYQFLAELPVIEQLSHTVGYSVTYLNTTAIPITVVDRLGMRLSVPRVNSFRKEYHQTQTNESVYITSIPHDHVKSGKLPEHAPTGNFYAVVQYNPGEQGIYQLGYFLHYLSQHKDKFSYLKDKNGNFIPVFDLTEFQEVTKIVTDYINEHKTQEKGKPKHQAQTRSVYHPNLGNMMSVAEYTRIAPSGGTWELADRYAAGNYEYNPGFMKIPLAFRISYEELVSNGMSVYDERLDIVVSLLDNKQAPDHPYDVNTHKPGSFGTFTTGTQEFDVMTDLLGETISKKNYNSIYRYVVDSEQYEGAPPVLYTPVHDNKVAKLRPHQPDEVYQEEGVYVTYRYWDESERVEKYATEHIPLTEETKLNQYKIFDSISGAKSSGEHKTRVEFDEARIAIESKIRKDELAAQKSLEEAKAKKLEAKRKKAEARQKEEELAQKAVKEKQRGFWDGVKSVVVAALPHLVTIAVTIFGMYLKSRI